MLAQAIVCLSGLRVPPAAAMVASALQPGCLEERWLAMAIRVARTAESLRVQRLLVWQAMEASRAGVRAAPDFPESAGDAIDAFEHVLAKLREHAGCAHALSVSQAKALLRTKGSRGAQAASWLGSLSKARNGTAHAKGRLLLSEIGLLFGMDESKAADEGETQCSDDFGAKSLHGGGTVTYTFIALGFGRHGWVAARRSLGQDDGEGAGGRGSGGGQNGQR